MLEVWVAIQRVRDLVYISTLESRCTQLRNPNRTKHTPWVPMLVTNLSVLSLIDNRLLHHICISTTYNLTNPIRLMLGGLCDIRINMPTVWWYMSPAPHQSSGLPLNWSPRFKSSQEELQCSNDGIVIILEGSLFLKSNENYRTKFYHTLAVLFCLPNRGFEFIHHIPLYIYI